MTLRLTAVLGAALMVGACQDAPGPMDLPAPTTDVAAVAGDETPHPNAVAQAVPAFAGYYLAGGQPTVALTDPAQRDAATAALDGWLTSRGFTDTDLQVAPAAYSWTQLSAWHDQAWPSALAVSGAVLSDLDEANNRLRFGAADAGAAATMQAAVVAAGVPAGAFVVDVVPAYTVQNTLRDPVRPVVGGYQINFFASPVSPVTLVCTLGFNAIPEGPEHTPIASFVTNSHCSNAEGDGANTPTDYYQPLRDGNDDELPDSAAFIGTEVDDPAMTISADCPLALPCRWSDASRAGYAEGVPFDLGRIARPAAFDQATGTLEVDDARPTFRIVDEQPIAVLGEVAQKVGRTTGWTGGEITGTCVNIIALGGVFVRRCQAIVNGGSDGGDSGSPVFGAQNRRGNPANGKVILFGILWGGSVDEEVVEFIYSPMFNIERELGLLQTQ